MLLPLLGMTQSPDPGAVPVGVLPYAVFDSSGALKWKELEQAYQPDPAVISGLREETLISELRFLVVLGTWCSDSREHVPAFLKTAGRAGLNYTLLGVNRKKECPGNTGEAWKDCASWNIEYVPTIIVYRNGNELGRMVETPVVSVEADLLNIIRKQ